MPELLRPEPPRSWRERLAGARATIDPARAAITAGIVLLLAVAGWWLVRPARPPVEAGLPRASTTAEGAAGVGEESGPQAASSTTLPAGAALAPPELFVQVAGAVVRPGVYRLADGARVIDLIERAGGALADADLQAMALAGRLVDGQRVQVPHMGEVLPLQATGGAGPPGTGGPGPTAPATPIDLNTASQPELEALPGIGPTTAQAILAYRDEHGPFASVEDLGEVQGIGPTRLDTLRELVRV